MSALNTFSLTKNLSYRTTPSNNNILLEEKPAFLFSPIETAKVRKLISNPNIQNNITNNNFQIYNQNINIFSQNQNQYNNQIVEKKTLVLDLDETLVHSSMTPFQKESDLEIKINVKGNLYNVYVLKRPFLEQFLLEMSNLYEIIVFTASLGEYAEPLLEILDKHKIVKHILNRNHCLFYQGLYIKDLKVINRDIKNLIIIDNNPVSYMFNKENGIPILSWYEDPKDTELFKIIPLMKYLARVNDVRPIINQIVKRKIGQDDELNYDIINEILNKEKSLRSNININDINILNNLNNKNPQLMNNNLNLLNNINAISNINTNINKNINSSNNININNINTNNYKDINENESNKINNNNIMKKIYIKKQNKSIFNLSPKRDKSFDGYKNNTINNKFNNINNLTKQIEIDNNILSFNKIKNQPINKVALNKNEMNYANNIETEKKLTKINSANRNNIFNKNNINKENESNNINNNLNKEETNKIMNLSPFEKINNNNGTNKIQYSNYNNLKTQNQLHKQINFSNSSRNFFYTKPLKEKEKENIIIEKTHNNNTANNTIKNNIKKSNNKTPIKTSFLYDNKMIENNNLNENNNPKILFKNQNNIKTSCKENDKKIFVVKIDNDKSNSKIKINQDSSKDKENFKKNDVNNHFFNDMFSISYDVKNPNILTERSPKKKMIAVKSDFGLNNFKPDQKKYFIVNNNILSFYKNSNNNKINNNGKDNANVIKLNINNKKHNNVKKNSKINIKIDKDKSQEMNKINSIKVIKSPKKDKLSRSPDLHKQIKCKQKYYNNNENNKTKGNLKSKKVKKKDENKFDRDQFLKDNFVNI